MLLGQQHNPMQPILWSLRTEVVRRVQVGQATVQFPKGPCHRNSGIYLGLKGFLYSYLGVYACITNNL